MSIYAPVYKGLCLSCTDNRITVGSLTRTRSMSLVMVVVVVVVIMMLLIMVEVVRKMILIR